MGLRSGGMSVNTSNSYTRAAVATLGQSVITAKPMVVENEFIMEEQKVNQSGTVLRGFLMNHDYMGK